MNKMINIQISAQPSDTTCGPTCLQAVYHYFEDHITLDQVLKDVPMLESGGTLAPLLGTHALGRGYKATIFSFNLEVFDPTWFGLPRAELISKLMQRRKAVPKRRIETGIDAYLTFIENGGEVLFEDLTSNLITRYLRQNIPILTGLSATYLYRVKREFGPDNMEDDVRGEPTGHFVVLSGYDRNLRQVMVSDPYQANPYSMKQFYHVNIYRLICSILLGVLTFDANLLIIEPKSGKNGHAYLNRR